MRFVLLLTFFLGLLALANPQIGTAQGLGSVFNGASDTSTASNVEEAIDRAADRGISVIVIDNAGNLLSKIDDTPVEEVVNDGSILMNLQDQAVQFRGALVQRLLQLPASINEVLFILRAASPDGTLNAFGMTVFYSLLMLGIGFLVERYVFAKRIAAPLLAARLCENPQGYTEKMPLLVFRFSLGVAAIFVSILVAYVIGAAIFGPIEDTAIQFTATLINLGYFICRMAANLWRLILTPFLSQYRIPALSDYDAKRLYFWLCCLATLDICVLLSGVWINELGLNYDVYAFMVSVLSAFIVLANMLLVLVNRQAISRALRNGLEIGESGLLMRFVSGAWAPLTIIYVIVAWIVLTYNLVLEQPMAVPLIAGAYGILISIIVVYGVINFLIERGFTRAREIRRLNAARFDAIGDDDITDSQKSEQPETVAVLDTTSSEQPFVDEDPDDEAGPQVHQPLSTFEALARRVAAILAFVAGLNAFFYIWDNEGAAIVESYTDQFLDIIIVLFIGYIAYQAFRIWIDGKIQEEGGEPEEGEPGDEGGGSSASRLATLLPLFRNFMLIAVVVTLALIVLMEVGVNVGPLFAGAGIIGVAVGFGSQALVRDIFAGAFFLFDDAFRKGEYLDVGGVKGTVEKISVRSFQLRHQLGALHTIPFGELQVMTNYSRDWVMMKLPLRVTYDTDVEHVRKLVKKLGLRLLEDPVIGPDFLTPLKSQGVIEMQDSAMIIRVKFMTKPGDQWVIRKRVYEEIRLLFEQEGIKFAHREVTVRLADGKVDDLTEQQRKAALAAAQASLDDELLDGDTAENGNDDR